MDKNNRYTSVSLDNNFLKPFKAIFFALVSFFLFFGLSTIQLYNTYASQQSSPVDLVDRKWFVLLTILISLIINSNFSIKNIIIWPIYYFMFLTIAYFFEMTLNLNNENF